MEIQYLWHMQLLRHQDRTRLLQQQRGVSTQRPEDDLPTPRPSDTLPTPRPTDVPPMLSPMDVPPTRSPSDIPPTPRPTDIPPTSRLDVPLTPKPADVPPTPRPVDALLLLELQAQAKLPQVGALTCAGAQPRKCCLPWPLLGILQVPCKNACGPRLTCWGGGVGQWRGGGAAAGGLRRLPGWGGLGQALEQSQSSGGGSSGWGGRMSRTGDLVGPRQEGECGWELLREANPLGTPSSSCVLGGRLLLPCPPADGG
ncbi:hypothetical protein P7K49_002039 [Saguinus oedipus]|uniref:Uncharacterized protein n=1 Tax=Saguinus oedipus TaxID=9490 RepID=A0ABQ9WIT9_SAGOE|nr:hypothetical protein P7K49_002039 [Saguinus oedipus]